jgi:hypothetical protein
MASCVPIASPRLHSRADEREIPLGAYELFQRASVMEESVRHKITHGASIRSYKEVMQQFSEAYDVESAP